MLLNDLSTGFVILCLLLIIFCLFFYVWMRGLAAYCRAAVEFVENSNKKSLSLARIAELDAAVTELTDAYTALYNSNKKLRSRVGMRRVREERANGVDSTGAPPADEAGRAAYKGALRNKLKADGRL